MAKLSMLSPVKVYVKSYSSSSPMASNTVNWATWTQLGWKSEKGCKWSIKTKVDDVADVEEIPGIVYSDIVEENLSVSLSLKQADFAALKNVVIGNTSTTGTVSSASKMTGGGGTVTELSLGFEGLNALGKKCVLWVPKVRPDDSIDFTFKKGSTELPVSFTGMFDANQPAGAMLYSYYEIV